VAGAGSYPERDRQLHAYKCLRKNICHRVLVSENCEVPAKHEANVPVKLLGSDRLHPSPPGIGPLSHVNCAKE